MLQLPRFSHPDGDIGTGFTARLVVQCSALASHGQVQVDAVQQWPGQLVAIARDLLGAAAAAASGVAQVAARAGVHLELLLANPIEGNRTVVEHAPETQLLESKNG